VEVSNILAVIDAEILKLQQARALLAGAGAAVKTGRGRPKGSKNAVTAAEVPAKTAKASKAVKAPAKGAKAKRQLSPEGRKAIADAMKRRWADRRKQATKAAVVK
jgi:hypothetical protein